MRGCCAAKMDDEYKSFLAELGGGPQDQGGPSGMRSMGGGGGGGGRQSRPGDDLPDNCKLYVGNLSPAVTDAVLKSLMEPFGNVLHAVVLLDMTSGTLPSAANFRTGCCCGATVCILCPPVYTGVGCGLFQALCLVNFHVANKVLVTAGQSRGFGFVHMDNAESATNAASGMSGKMMDGRPLVVRLRSEGPDKKGGFDRPRGFGPMENDESKVGNGAHAKQRSCCM